MADRVYPTAKPNPPPGAGALNGGAAPAKTTHLYDPNRPRPVYRPHQGRSRRGRTCSCRKFCCLTFIYTLIAILSILLVAAIAACIFYVLYHPKHPTFSISTVKISKFNLTSVDSSGDFSRLNSRIDFTLTAKNPNKKHIVFNYDPFSVDVSVAGGVAAGNATVPGFTHVEGNTTVIRGTVVSDPTKTFDRDTVSGLKSDLGKKSGFPMTVEVDTKVQVQMGKLKSKRVGIRVHCEGIRGFPTKNATAKKPTPSITTGAKCKVDLRIKIWKFTF